MNCAVRFVKLSMVPILLTSIGCGEGPVSLSAPASPARDATASPDAVNSVVLGGVRQISARGVTLALDRHRGRLSDNRGHSITLDAASQRKYEQLFDYLDYEAVRYGRLFDGIARRSLNSVRRPGAAPLFRITLRQPEKRAAGGRMSALRDAGSGLPTVTSSVHDLPRLGVLGGKSSVDAETGFTCWDISREMAALQIKVRNANQGIADAIAGALALGFDLFNPGTFKASGAYQNLILLYDESMALKAASNIQLAFYGAMFNGYNCWEWLYNGIDGTNSGGGGGGSAGGMGASLQCHYEYGAIEASYDGGLTWSVWWSGQYEVCSYVAAT